MSGQPESLRSWLEYVAQTAIDMLDAMDAPHDGLEPDDDEPVETAEEGWR